MKMEHRLVAPHAGAVTLAVRRGDRVALDEVLATIDPQLHEPHDEVRDERNPR
jgi:predicted deacylase